MIPYTARKTVIEIRGSTQAPAGPTPSSPFHFIEYRYTPPPQLTKLSAQSRRHGIMSPSEHGRHHAL